MDEKILACVKEVSLSAFQFTAEKEKRALSTGLGLKLGEQQLRDLLKSDLVSLLREIRIDEIHLSMGRENPEITTKIQLKLDGTAVLALLQKTISAIVDEIAIDNVLFGSCQQDRELLATIGLKISEEQLKNLIKGELPSLFSDISTDQIKISLCSDETACCHTIELAISNLSLKNPHKQGIQIEQLSAVLTGFRLDQEPAVWLKSSKISVSRLLLRISQKWVSDELKKLRPVYEEKGFSDIVVVFLNKLIIIRGSYRKGISFPFSIEIKTRTDKNRLVIELSQFNLAEILPLPHWLQNLIIDFVKEKIPHKFTVIEKSTFYVDILGALPLPVDLCFKDLRVEKESLVLEI